MVFLEAAPVNCAAGEVAVALPCFAGAVVEFALTVLKVAFERLVEAADSVSVVIACSVVVEVLPFPVCVSLMMIVLVIPADAISVACREFYLQGV